MAAWRWSEHPGTSFARRRLASRGHETPFALGQSQPLDQGIREPSSRCHCMRSIYRVWTTRTRDRGNASRGGKGVRNRGGKGVRNRFYAFFGQNWGQLIPMKATVFASDRLAVSRPRLRFIPETVPDTFLPRRVSTRSQGDRAISSRGGARGVLRSTRSRKSMDAVLVVAGNRSRNRHSARWARAARCALLISVVSRRSSNDQRTSHPVPKIENPKS